MYKESYLEINKSLLYVKSYFVNKDQDTPTLIFLHDALGSTEQWKDFPELLSQKTNLNTIIFDRQGSGRSSPILLPRTPQYMHEEAYRVLPEVLRKLNIKRPILFGHSDGGTIALLYASKFQPLAIICEAAHIVVEKETIKGIESALKQKLFFIAKLKKYHGDKTERLFDAWHRIWLAPEFRDWNIKNSLKSIKCPALLLQGDSDEYATKLHLKKIEKGIGDTSRSVLIKNCGHIPHLHAKDEILKETAEFIKAIL